MSQSALVGQQQQAFRVLIQPSHREQALPLQILRQQVQHRCPPAVLRGGQIPRRLVQHDPSIPAPVQLFSVDRDHSLLRVRLFLSRPGRDPVHRHPSLTNQVLHFPAGPPPRRGDDLIQPLRRHN